MSFKIQIMRFGERPRTVPGLTGLTEEQAQEICSDPETSSLTCKGKAGKARTRRYGEHWFYGYTEE